MPAAPFPRAPRPEGEMSPGEVYAQVGDVLHWAAVMIAGQGNPAEAEALAACAARARDMESHYAVHPRHAS